MFALKNKQTEEVAVTLTNLFWLFGFPSILHSDNGKEFKSKTVSELCRKHQIKQVHGAPRTPSTQGLVERNNRTVKENILNILKERDESLGKWCTVLGEAAYKKNITLHRAINKVPYEVVFSMLPRKEMPEGTYWWKGAIYNPGKRKCTHPGFWLWWTQLSRWPSTTFSKYY